MEPKSKIKIRKISDDCTLYVFWCPACKETHSFNVGEGEEKWSFNGDMDKPSFVPSLKYDKCHLVLLNGVIEYCADCWHDCWGLNVLVQEF